MKKYIILILLLCANLNAMHLFRHYTSLKNTIPHVQLANVPTPILKCSNLEKALDHPSIFIKQDGLIGMMDLYGGNKVRKLEFLLGDALRSNAKTIVTYDCVWHQSWSCNWMLRTQIGP